MKKLLLLVLITFGFTSEPGTSVLEYQLLVFEGSDWCTNCIQLEKRILSDTQFLDSLEANNIEIRKVDFPQRNKLSKKEIKANDSIATAFGFEGIFPTLVLSRRNELLFERINFDNKDSEQLLAEIKSKKTMLE